MALYQPAVLSRDIRIPMNQVGGSIPKLLENALRSYEGKCSEEGYVKRGTVKLHHHSCGILEGTTVRIQVVFECKLMNPLVGQSIRCIAESNTKAGVKARIDDTESSLVVFLARDHHYQHPTFSEIKEGDKFAAKIVGKRYEINDAKISVLAVMDETYVEPPSVEVPEEVVDVEDDVLVFYAKAKDVYPGKGANEHINQPKDYDALSKIQNWRSQLGPLDVAPFKWSGKGILPEPFKEGTEWNSIEHALQGSKFKFYKFDDADKFSLTSGDAIGKGDGSFAEKNKKLHAIKDLAPWEALYPSVLKDVYTAKFTQNKDKMRILSLTNTAHLIHHVVVRGKPSQQVRATHLEEMRDSVKE